jgi:hypothetical protein
MKSDAEVVLMKRERAKGRTQEQAAARVGMGIRTLRKYEHLNKLPSQLKAPRDYRTRPNPFEEDWLWVTAEIKRDPALQATTLFGLLGEQHPGRYQTGQLRTLQRQIAVWKAQHGPEKEVFFPQVHEPGRVAQSDFTHMSDLDVTLGGVLFQHLVFHLVLTYSNVEAVCICLSESFESLAEGLEACLWQIGGVPREHRTDHLSAAIRPLDQKGREQATARYQALLAHYGLEASVNNAGEAHENGDVEQAHHRFKVAVDQALRVRASRDFPDRAAYVRFLQDLVRKRNLTRETRFAEERQVLRPLPTMPLGLCREFRVAVSRFSTIQVLANTYSVPSRLIGTSLTVRVHAETIEAYQGTAHLLSVPRLLGKAQHRIDYHHVVWSLVRKPGAFANYRYHDDLYPTLTFRRAYDALRESVGGAADRHYVRLLHLAASTSEGEVETALGLLLEQRHTPLYDTVRDLVHVPSTSAIPTITEPILDLSVYDRLLGRSVRVDGEAIGVKEAANA